MSLPIILSGFTTPTGYVNSFKFTIPSGYNRMDYLIVGGGGVTFFQSSGNGGAGGGGVLTGTITNPVAGEYDVFVGVGGGRGGSQPNSSFYGMTALAGGRGASVTDPYGYDGGSGGGGSGYRLGEDVNYGGAGTAGQGYAGGKGGSGISSTGCGGGGGGAGGVGQDATGYPDDISTWKAGDGGVGIASSISGTLLWYAGGGGGQAASGAGTAGAGGSGVGGSATTHGIRGGGAGGGTATFNSLGGNGVVWIKLYTVPTPEIYDLNVTSATDSTITVDFSVSGQTSEENQAQIYSGGTWVEVDNFTGTSYTYTGLESITEYSLRICALFETNYYCSDSITGSTTISPLAPTGLTETSTYFDTIGISWVNNGGASVTNLIQIYSGGTWNDFATISGSATSYTLSGLTANTSYIIRVVAQSFTNNYPSYSITSITRNIQAPTLNSVNISTIIGTWNWTNNTSSEGIKVYYKKSSNTTWTLFDDVSSGTTTSVIQTLEFDSDYNFKVASYYGTNELDSNIISHSTTVFPQTFCSQVNGYDITNSTCGNADGIIEINDVFYMTIYNFSIVDGFGDSYTINNDPYSVDYGKSEGLSAGWYRLIANVKPEFKDQLNNDSCNSDWIGIENDSSSIVLTDFRKTNAQCGPFDRQTARMSWTINSTGSSFNAYFFKQGTTGVYSQILNHTNSTLVLANLIDGCYRGIIVNNDDNCTTLIDLNCINSSQIASIGGIKRLFITAFNQDLEYDYWKSSDDDYYLESLDTSKFLSSKIKSYYSGSGGTINWYSIPVQGDMTLAQNLAKTRQGFILTDTLNVTVPKAVIDRFQDFTMLFGNKWVYVIEDGNGYWWTGGFEVGATVEKYIKQTGERGTAENQYQFMFHAVSSDKLLTNLDQAWVNQWILGEGWIPSMIDGINVWYGNTVNNGLDRRSLPSGTTITRWDDQTGNGITANAQGSLHYWNGEAITSDSLDQYFNITYAFGQQWKYRNYPTGTTTFIVAKNKTTTGSQVFASYENSVSVLRTFGSDTFQMVSGAAPSITGISPLNEKKIYVLHVDANKEYVRVNGVNGAIATGSSSPSFYDFNQGFRGDAYYYEVINYLRPLNEDEITKVEFYLNQKYNILT